MTRKRSLHGTLHRIQDCIDHGLRSKPFEDLSYCLNIRSILHTSLFFWRCYPYSMAIYFLRCKGDQRRCDKAESMKGCKVSASVSARTAFFRAYPYLASFSNITVAYGETPPATPLSRRKKTTTSCRYLRISEVMVTVVPSSRSFSTI
jgi:hypothetical protein